MRAPFREATAMLGAAGFALPVQSLSVIRNMLRRPAMPHAVRYALVRDPGSSIHKPSVFESLHSLANSIHRQLDGRPVQLLDEYMTFRDEATPRKGVNVWRLDPLTGEQDRFIGWAWLDGGDRHLLSAKMPRRRGGLAEIRAA